MKVDNPTQTPQPTIGELRLLNAITQRPDEVLKLDPKQFPAIENILQAMKLLVVKCQPITCLNLYRENPSQSDFETFSASIEEYATPSQIPFLLEQIALEHQKNTWQEIRYEISCCTDVIAGKRLLELGLERLKVGTK